MVVEMMQKHDVKRPEAVEKTLQAKQATADKAVTSGKGTSERTLKAGFEAASKGFNQAATASKEQFQQFLPQAAGAFNAMTGFQRGNLDAFAAAGMVAAKGVESLSGELLAFNRKVIEDSVANAKRLFDCKTINELVEVQADLARANFEQMIAQGTRITDLAVKVANEMAAPMREHAADAVGKMGQPFGA